MTSLKTSLKDSLNKKNLSTLFRNILQRSVNILFPIGIVVIAVAILTFLFENLAWNNLFFLLFFLGFGYWGYQHGQVDLSKQSKYVQPYWKVLIALLIALLGLITFFGMYLTLAVVFKYDFQVVLEYILIRFSLLAVAYVLGYGSGHLISAN